MRRPVAALISFAAMSLLAALSPLPVYAQPAPGKVPVSQGPVKRINPYFSTQATLYSDNSVLERAEINGPPKPPYGYHIRATAELPAPMPAAGVNTLAVPAFEWVFGCSAVSGSMIAGYYDRNGYPNIYTGPTGGGVIPLTEDPSWGTWTDKTGDTYPNNPLIASHLGLDGRTTRGSIDDYWITYLSSLRDPYITGSWTQHAWGDAVGDYMKTSQYAYKNVDGSTSFYYIDAATPLTCAAMETYNEARLDGTYGRKLFYEARGYSVTDCYTQMTDNVHAGGFSFAQFKAEIDAGRPVLLNLEGHSVVGVGYVDSNTVYIHDTWDQSDHTMTWGGSYSGMALWGVSIVNLATAAGTPNLSVSPNPYDFGSRNLNTTTTQTFTIANTGTAPLSVAQLSLSGAADFKVTTDNCSGTTVSPTANCTVLVSFTPTVEGAQSATLTIPSNDPDSPATVSLTGTGTGVILLPDLYGAWSKVNKTQKRGNYTVTGTWTTSNGGTASASNVMVNVYLSAGTTHSVGDTLIGTYKIPSIAVGASKATSIRYSAGATDPGSLYLIAVIDQANSVAESDETNNSDFADIP